MRAPHTSPPLPATTTTASLLVSHRSPAAAAAAAACWENSISNDDLRLNHDDDRDDMQAQHVQDHLLIDTLAAASASASASAAQQMKPKRRNHIARLPQELLLHILTFVHSSLVYPPNPSDKAFFLPLEQRRQTASLAFLRLAAVSPQFAAAILSPQASSLWKHIDGSATFPIPPAKIETGLHEQQEQKAQQALLFRPRHLAPALVVALARTAGPAVTSLNLRGVQFTSAVEPHGGISSLFSAAQLFEHILEAQGVPSSRDAQPPNFAYAQDKHAGAYMPKHDSDDDEEPLPAMSPLSHFSVLGPPLPQSSVPAPPLLPRTTQLTHLDLRSLRIDPVQLASARRALSALLAASPSLVSLRLANASPRLVDDALLDSSLTHPHRLRELDVSRCAGVSAEGVVRLLRRVAEYQSDQVQKGDEDTARDAGLAVLRIVGLRTKPPAPISASGPEPREEVSTRRRRRAPVQLDDDGDDDNADDSDEDGQAAEDGGRRGSDESSASSPAAAVPTNPLEDLMALLGRTSAHSLEVLDASYVLDLTDAHVFALAHTNPQAVHQQGATAASASASTSASSHSGPPKQMTLRHAQTKLSRALASAAHFPTHRSALARALDESSSLTNTVERTLFPRLRSLALSSNPRLTAASCGFLVGALPRCETLELGGWAPRAFLDFERDADGRRVQRRQRRGRRAGEQELPGDGPLVDLLESMPNIRRVDLEGASEITDAVLRVLTPAPAIRPTPSCSSAPTGAGAAMLPSEPHSEDGVEPQAQPQSQPGQYLTHLILSHAYRLSARATLDLMRGATQLVHLELDDTRAGCDLVAKEWAALTKARKSGLRAAAVALALLPPSQQQQKEGRQQKEEAPTPYLSLVDCRGFSKEEYERLSRRGYIRAREAIGVRPRLSHVPSELEQKAAEDGVAASDVGQQSEGGAAKEVVEEAEVFEWGREWFGYEGRAEVVPVRDAPAANSASAGAGAGIVSPDTNATTPSPPGQPASTPSVATASPPSRASRLTLSLPLGLGIAALARRASGHLTTPESEDEEEAGGGQGDAGNAHQLSIPGLPFRIRVQRGGGGQNAGGGGGANSNTGGGGLLMSGGGGADKHGFEGDETNPALGVLKSFWGWQTVDARTKARKKRLAKEEKARKAAAAAAAAAASAASRNRGMSMRPNGPNSRSLSFGGLDAALRGNGNESPQAGGSGGASTGLRNSTAAALALLLRRTGASSAGAAMSAAFGPMSMASPPLSRSPSPPTSPAVVGGGIPIPGAPQQGGGGGRARTAAGGSPGRLGQGLARRSDSGFSGFLLQASPSTPGAQSTMSAFSLMALAGQRGGAIPPASSSSAYAYAFSSSPSTSPSLERHMHLHYGGGGGGEGRNHQLSTRQLLAFAEAAAAAGLSATEAEMLAIAATSTTATARARTRSLTATTTESGFGRSPRGQSGPLSAVAAGKRPQIHSRLNSGASASSAAGSSGGGSQNYQPLLFSPLHPQGRAQQQQRGEDLALVRTQSSGGLSSLREKMRERGGRAKGKIRRLLQSASGVGSASAGASPSGSRSGSVLNFGATIHQIGSPSSSSSRPGSGMSTPRRRMTAPATPTFGMGGRGAGAGAGASGSSAPLPPPSLPLPAGSPSSTRTSVPTPTPAAAPTMPVPQHYAPPAAAGGGALGMQGLGWDEDEDEDEEDQEGDGQGLVLLRRGLGRTREVAQGGVGHFAGKTIPCGRRKAASGNEGRLEPFPRLVEAETHSDGKDEARTIRKKLYDQASRAFRAAFESACAKLYAPAIADVTEHFVALDRQLATMTLNADAGADAKPSGGLVMAARWLPGCFESRRFADGVDLSPQRMSTALLFHSTAQSPAFYSELDRSFARHSLRMVRLTGQQCISFKPTMALLTRRLIDAALSSYNDDDDDDDESEDQHQPPYPPLTLLELKAHLDAHPIGRNLVIHFPVVEEFPSRLLSDIIVALSHSQLPLALLMGVGSVDAFEQALRAPETQAALEVSRFSITSGGPAEVFGRIMTNVFLNPIKPPPLYLDYGTYQFIHSQFFKNNNDIDALFDAIDLAVLHHFHTQPLSAFASAPIHADTAPIGKDVRSDSWRGHCLSRLQNLAVEHLECPRSDAVKNIALDDDEEKEEEDEEEEQQGGGEESWSFRYARLLETEEDYMLSQLPALRLKLDSFKAWQARALMWLCCIERFLAQEDGHGNPGNPAGVLRFARRANYAMVCDDEHDFYRQALEGDISAHVKSLEERMNTLEHQQLGALLEMLTAVTDHHCRQFEDECLPFAKDRASPWDREGDLADDRPTISQHYNLWYDNEAGELQDLQVAVFAWVRKVEGWREGEELARNNADQEIARVQAEAERKAAEYDASVALPESEDGKVLTSRDGPSVFRPNFREDARLQAVSIEADWHKGYTEGLAEYERIRTRVVTAILGFIKARCTPSAASLDEEEEARIPAESVLEIWQCRAAHFLSQLLDPAPRHEIISQLSDPFPVLERYGLAELIGTSFSSSTTADADSDADDVGPGPATARTGGNKIDWSRGVRSLALLKRSQAMPDICRAFQLYQSSERYVNFAHWFDAFVQSVRADRALLVLDRGALELQARPRGMEGALGGRGKEKWKAKANGGPDHAADENGEHEDVEDSGEELPEAAAVIANKANGKRRRGEDMDAADDDDDEDDDQERNTPRKRARLSRGSATPTARRPRPEAPADAEAGGNNGGSDDAGASVENEDKEEEEEEEGGGGGGGEEEDEGKDDAKDVKDLADIQARFALAVNELAIMGFLKGTRRKPETTMKVVFDLPPLAAASSAAMS
ncbi:hypothetical protein OC844_002405 [Tilletia horrida]|nr:hypothetical protein OC844_002405 [Tilletia horrida]